MLQKYIPFLKKEHKTKGYKKIWKERLMVTLIKLNFNLKFS